MTPAVASPSPSPLPAPAPSADLNLDPSSALAPPPLSLPLPHALDSPACLSPSRSAAASVHTLSPTSSGSSWDHPPPSPRSPSAAPAAADPDSDRDSSPSDSACDRDASTSPLPPPLSAGASLSLPDSTAADAADADVANADATDADATARADLTRPPGIDLVFDAIPDPPRSWAPVRAYSRIMSWMYDAIAKATSKEGAAGKAYLSGNFGPVQDELFAQDLPVIDGKLPYGLDGCYARVGPNPFFEPTAGYHWFDGDGMIHAVRIRNGKASYCNRYIETDRLKQERAAGRPLFIKLGDLYGKRGIALLLWNKLAKCVGAIRTTLGSGTANTALVYHAGRLLSLNEGDLPYGLRVLSSGLVETLGRLKVDKAWKTSFTAHPKVDAATGELLFMGYSFARNPYVTAGVLDEQGKLTKRWGVELPYPTMMHDMAATKNYIVLLHFPLCFDGEAMVRDGSIPFRLRTDLPTRMGLVKRDQPSSDKAEVTWFELPGPGAMAFHVANAWEDAKGDVKIYACQMDAINLDLDKGDLDKERPMMTEYTLSPATGTASARRLTEVVGDFPVIHPGKSTLPCRYSWVATMDTSAGTPSFTGIAKIDLGAKPGKDACCGKIVYPPGCYGGEAVYVPRATTIADPKWASRLSEDDGWLMVYLYDSKQDVSYMAIYDARTMDKKPVCRVRLPRRVPYGFHGTWVTEPQLKAQVMWV